MMIIMTMMIFMIIMSEKMIVIPVIVMEITLFKLQC